MKILLLYPKVKLSLSIAPPLGLGYLASVLKKDGHEVNIIDFRIKSFSLKKFLKILKQEQPQLVGITILSLFYLEARRLIHEIRQNTQIITVIGGPHVTALPQLSLKDTGAHFAILGEGEGTFRDLVRSLESGRNPLRSIPGLACLSPNGSLDINYERPLWPDLDQLPFPEWDLINPAKYPPLPHGALVRKLPVAPIISTRGCPFECRFCASPLLWKKKLRKRSPQNVVDEMEFLTLKYGVREFHFEDDNFTFSKPHALGICQEIQMRGLKTYWSFPNGVRVDYLDEELLQEMKAAGCYMIALGIESGNQELLERVGKKLDLSRVAEVVKLCKNIGIKTQGFFILGLPGESKESAQYTIKFAKDLGLDFVRFSLLYPLPGTPIWEEWKDKEENEIDWNVNVHQYSILDTEHLSKQEITRLQKRALRAFYFRPRTLFNTFLGIRPKQYFYYLRRLLNIFMGI